MEIGSDAIGVRDLRKRAVHEGKAWSIGRTEYARRGQLVVDTRNGTYDRGNRVSDSRSNET